MVVPITPASPPTETPPAALTTTGGVTSMLSLSQRDCLTLATFTPPQTQDQPVAPTKGAHCLVIDVSFSMEELATVKTEDGDAVNHGFTMLDIAKHAMCTYVASLSDDDWVCVSSFASAARLVIEWTPCTNNGKRSLFDAIKGLAEEGSTNLTAGISTGFRAFEEGLPPPVAANPDDYALLLALATDGQPSSGTHPPAGPSGYADFAAGCAAAVAAAHGRSAVPSLVAIGLGNDLDSRLLASFSDQFLHIPDPGSVGSFMVNLLAATRATARVDAISYADTSSNSASNANDEAAAPTAPSHSAVVANHAVLRLSPAAAVVSVPGQRATVVDGEVHVPLGSLTYDQPRQLVILTTEGAPPLSATMHIGDALCAACAAPTAAAANDETFDAQVARTAAAVALDLQERRLSVVDGLGAPTSEVAARLAREGGRFGDVTITLVWNDQSDLDLHVTLPSSEEIFYSHKKSRCGLCELDVDMNAGSSNWSKEPVENVYCGDAESAVQAPCGRYKVQVNNFGYHSDEGLPTPRDVPFTVSVRMLGDTIEYTGVCKGSKQKVTVVEFDYYGWHGGAPSEESALLRERTRRQLAEKAMLRGVPQDLLAQLTTLLPESALQRTLKDEACLGTQPEKFRTWGRHYLMTLPQMLRAQRRSNFRDAALQGFGCDASGRDAFFGQLADEAELCFAELEPPRPSGLERLERQRLAAATSAAERVSAQRASAARHTAYTHMPDEFMRGGGCFAPEALVHCVEADGEELLLPIGRIEAGMRVRTASGGTAAVRCVVVSPCEHGMAQLIEMSGGLQITAWHPLQDTRGRWRFPLMLGKQIVRELDYVYNLVLDREHVAMVGGTPCATLGHGIDGPVIGHPFWGTRAVIDVLKAYDGWDTGHVMLEAPLRSPSAAIMLD